MDMRTLVGILVLAGVFMWWRTRSAVRPSNPYDRFSAANGGQATWPGAGPGQTPGS